MRRVAAEGLAALLKRFAVRYCGRRSRSSDIGPAKGPARWSRNLTVPRRAALVHNAFHDATSSRRAAVTT